MIWPILVDLFNLNKFKFVAFVANLSRYSCLAHYLVPHLPFLNSPYSSHGNLLYKARTPTLSQRAIGRAYIYIINVYILAPNIVPYLKPHLGGTSATEARTRPEVVLSMKSTSSGSFQGPHLFILDHLCLLSQTHWPPIDLHWGVLVSAPSFFIAILALMTLASGRH